MFNKLKFIFPIIIFSIPLIGYCMQITVPSAPTNGYFLVSTSTGAYIATTTSPAHFSSVMATSSTDTSFFNGIVKIVGNFFLSSLSQGFAYLGTNGQVNTISTSTLAGQVFPFTSNVGYNSTSTTIGFLNGFFTTASTTFSQLSTGAVYDQNGLILAHATSSASVANQDVWRDGNANIFTNNFIPNLTSTVSSGGTVVLTPSSSRYQLLTGSSAHTFQLPNANASGMATGATFDFNNNSVGVLTVTDHGGNVVATVPFGGFTRVIETDNGSANGAWETHAYLGHNNVSGTGTLSIGTTTNTIYPTTISSSTKGQLALEGADTDNLWTLRGIGNNFYIATASPTTWATSSPFDFNIDSNGITNVNRLTLATSSAGCATVMSTGEIASIGTACGSGGSSSAGPINTLQASNGSGGFIATGTPQLTVGNLLSTTTATSTFAGPLQLNDTLYGNVNWGSGTALPTTIYSAGDKAILFWNPTTGAFGAFERDTGTLGASDIGGSSALLGYDNKASGYASLSAGSNNLSSGAESFTAGTANTAAGDYSTSLGNTNNINSVSAAALAFGQSNTITGSGNSITGGFSNTTSGGALLDIAITGEATSTNAISIGDTTHAGHSLDAAAIGGDANYSEGQAGIVLGGNQNRGYGDYSGILAGFQNIVIGNNSMTIGNSLTVSGNDAVSIGNGLIANPFTNEVNNQNGSIWLGSNSNLPTIDITQANGVGSTGDVGISTTTPKWSLQIASTSMPQLALTGNPTDNHWTFRSIGNQLSIATASPTTFATTSIDALTINNSGQILGQSGSQSAPTFSFASDKSSGIYDNVNGNMFFIRGGAVGLSLQSGQIVNSEDVTTSIANSYFLAHSAGSASAPNYTFVSNTNTGIFTPGTNLIGFSTNGIESARITSTGQWAIGTTSGYAQLTIASTTASATFKPQLSLTDSSAGANSKHWTFASEGGNLYIGTSTDLQATSSLSFLSILGNGMLGIATTTTWTNSTLNVVGTSTFQGNFANFRASTTAATTQTIDWSTIGQDNKGGTFADIMLTGNTNIVLNSTSSNPIDGGFYKFRICQDPTGSRTLTWANPAPLRWWNGTTTITSTANKCTFIGMIYSSTNGNKIYSVVASTTNVDIK